VTFLIKTFKVVMAEFRENLDRDSTVSNILQELMQRLSDIETRLSRPASAMTVMDNREIVQRLTELESRLSRPVSATSLIDDREFMWRPTGDEHSRSRSVSVTDLHKIQKIAEGTGYPQAKEDLTRPGGLGVDICENRPGTIESELREHLYIGAIEADALGGPRRSARLKGKPPVTYAEMSLRPAYGRHFSPSPAHCLDTSSSHRSFPQQPVGVAPKYGEVTSPSPEGSLKDIRGKSRGGVISDLLPVRPLSEGAHDTRDSGSGALRLSDSLGGDNNGTRGTRSGVFQQTTRCRY
jgi:hypothetical protein